jgi:zinc/manganese transport system permease protein
MIVIAVIGAFLASIGGLLLSYYFSLPSGPAIILTAGLVYVASLLFGPVGSIVAGRLPRRHLEA